MKRLIWSKIKRPPISCSSPPTLTWPCAILNLKILIQFWSRARKLWSWTPRARRHCFEWLRDILARATTRRQSNALIKCWRSTRKTRTPRTKSSYANKRLRKAIPRRRRCIARCFRLFQNNFAVVDFLFFFIFVL